MKKLILILVLCLGVTIAFGQVDISSVNNKMSKSTAHSQQQAEKKTPISQAELKAGIMENIRKTYPDYKLLEAFKVENADGRIVSYEVMIASNTKKITLLYDKDGNFLSREYIVNPIPTFHVNDLGWIMPDK